MNNKLNNLNYQNIKKDLGYNLLSNLLLNSVARVKSSIKRVYGRCGHIEDRKDVLPYPTSETVTTITRNPVSPRVSFS